MQKLSLDFYKRDVHLVAKDLLGKIFVRKLSDKIISGKIVEVEAYDGSVDESAHSFNGITKRNQVMFKGGGFLYVYFTYGMHYCANVVTGNVKDGCAVLIRAIEPIDGIDIMAKNRFNKKILSEKEKINLTNGPAKICQAFNITIKENGISLTDNEIFIADNKSIHIDRIGISKRIGIKKSVDLPWRYFIKDNPFVSKK
ncbi:MAG: DNA-3-methyladenine glycosylase [Melioribacteraceae bacterium]|nr:DNA-3-methyladenine glycosylase [Melioribacteraceae bacterium]